MSRNGTPMNDGGPAFPVPLSKGWEGMRLRDYFAASISPFLFQHCWTNGGPEWERELAKMAYRVSDAMLREREKQK